MTMQAAVLAPCRHVAGPGLALAHNSMAPLKNPHLPGLSSQTLHDRWLLMRMCCVMQNMGGKGVQRIETAVGDAFDPNTMEAMTTVPCPGGDAKPGSIANIWQVRGHAGGEHFAAARITGQAVRRW